MRKILFASLIFLYACGGNKTPDVSHIEAPLTINRFDQDFFRIDTLQLSQQLDVLHQKYPEFLGDYLFGILGINNRLPQEELQELIKRFIRDYTPVYQDAQARFKDMSVYQKEIQQGLKFVKYYFPQYQLPNQLNTFIGPMDAFFEAGTGIYGDIITQSGLGTGLQLHLGADYHLYHSEMGMLLYPTYLSRKFAPEYITVNNLKNIAEDIYPGQNTQYNLISQMVEKGKKLYLVDLFLPDTHDTLKLGYTASQLNGCIKNEGLIWNFFIKNELLYSQDVNRIRHYLNEGPNTPELGDGSPGYIALFTGRQIVKKYMERFPETTLETLLKKDPEEIFMESKYKPK